MAPAAPARGPAAAVSALLPLLLLAGAALGEARLVEPLTVPPAAAEAPAAGALLPNDRISSSDPCLAAQSSPACISSPGFKYALCLQPTGNITLAYRDLVKVSTTVYWQGGAPASSDQRPLQLCVAADGNVVVKDRQGEAVWSSSPAGGGSASVRSVAGPMVGYLQDDGAFTVYDATCKLVWSTGKYPRARAVRPPCSSGAGSATPAQTRSWRRRYLNWVNSARRAAGAQPLVLLDRLNNAAQRQADSMNTAKQLTHDDLAAGLSYNKRLLRDLPDYVLCGIGENICSGEGTPAEAHNAFMLSPSHKANVLTPDYRAFGVAYNNGWWSEIYAGCVTPSATTG